MMKMVATNFGIDYQLKMVYTESGMKRLPDNDFRLVRRLAERPGIVVETADLIKSIWGDRPPSKYRGGHVPTYLRTLVSHTRLCMGGDYIASSSGIGYRLVI